MNAAAALLPKMLVALGLAASAVGVALLLRATWRRRAAAALARAEAAEQRAAAAERRLGLLAAELRGPGLAMLGRAERLLRGLNAAADRQPVAGAARIEAEALAAAARDLLRLAEQLNELLAFQAGPPTLREDTFPLRPLLEETIAAVAAEPGAGGRHWRIAPELATLSLHADRRALRGALRSVLARAARLSRAGDCIELRLEPDRGDSIAIVIEDEGSGVPSEDLAPEALEGDPVAIPPAAVGRTRGVGLGLAVARALLEAHGGGLELEAAPGIGARASLLLPRSRVAASGAIIAAAA
jgi:signal transduction histidine kinase